MELAVRVPAEHGQRPDANTTYPTSDQAAGTSGLDRRHAPTEIPVLVIPVDKRVRDHRGQQGRHPLVLGAGVPVQARRDPAAASRTSSSSPPPSIGHYVGRCAELCGTYHSQMNFEVRVVSPDDYAKYLTNLAAIPSGDPARQSKALQSIGEAPCATTTHPFKTDRLARSASESAPPCAHAELGGSADETRSPDLPVDRAVLLRDRPAVYAWWTNQTLGRVEVAGTAALVLSGGLLGISGSFFWFVSRRIDARPEDRNDAEIAEGAGELGFFSPGSYWPRRHRARPRS